MIETAQRISCFHCGDTCSEDHIYAYDKSFCCNGCKLVYEILAENNLCSYYDLNTNPGNKTVKTDDSAFSFLDEASISEKLIYFSQGNQCQVLFHIPSMHCSSCIWLLENFKSLDRGVLSSSVNFTAKELHLTFDKTKTSLRKIVTKLASTGYEPMLNLNAVERISEKKHLNNRILKIGIAGFCFGNIMMLSFPEYFSSGIISELWLKPFFSYMILLLSLPVFFYSASEFFIRSVQSLKYKTTSIDIPIALGIAAIFLRSAYEILMKTGAGYFDSGSGLIFFMLIGRWFQDFTFDSLSFDRDYKSWFPVAATRIVNGIESSCILDELKYTDRILVRNQEIIPADAVLLKEDALIDYSFVTGESLPVKVQHGNIIYAGAKNCGKLAELEVLKTVSNSHLMQLWNRNYPKSTISRFERIVQKISKWFTLITLIIAAASALYWWPSDTHKAVIAFTSVLVIACPCALALSAPFTYGNILRILGKKKIYLRNYHVLENIPDIDTIVFDKTGTLTDNNSVEIIITGDLLSEDEKKAVASLCRNSTHPYSIQLLNKLDQKIFYKVAEYNELTGEGISGFISGDYYKIGKNKFVGLEEMDPGLHLTVNNNYRCTFHIKNSYRSGIETLVKNLAEEKLNLFVLSGDNNRELRGLQMIFADSAVLLFNQSPEDKLDFVKRLMDKQHKVLMIGDGLNDAGALMQSNCGIAVTDNISLFTPACDGIIEASQLTKLNSVLKYSQASVRIIILSFIISLLYNFIGLSFAVTGTLSPLIAAILMPVSTISLVLFTVISGSIKGRLLKF